MPRLHLRRLRHGVDLHQGEALHHVRVVAVPPQHLRVLAEHHAARVRQKCLQGGAHGVAAPLHDTGVAQPAVGVALRHVGGGVLVPLLHLLEEGEGGVHLPSAKGELGLVVQHLVGGRGVRLGQLLQVTPRRARSGGRGHEGVLQAGGAGH